MRYLGLIAITVVCWMCPLAAQDGSGGDKVRSEDESARGSERRRGSRGRGGPGGRRGRGGPEGRGGRGGPGSDRGGGGGGQFAPFELGDAIPDVSAYDDAGKKFALRERIKGKYSVIVFGCLT